MAEDGIKGIAETAPQAGQDASGLDMAQSFLSSALKVDK